MKALGKKVELACRNSEGSEMLVQSSLRKKEESRSVFTSNDDKLCFIKRVTGFLQRGVDLGDEQEPQRIG